MTLTQITHLKIVGTLGIVAFVVSVLGSTLLSQTTYAWCDQNAGFDDICKAQSYDSLPADRKTTTNEQGKLTYQQFDQISRSCMTGERTNFDWNTMDEGTCINAATSCINNMIDVSKCSNADILADISDCDEGQLGGEQDCDRLRIENVATIDKNRESALAKARSSCSTTGSEADKQKQADDCEKAVADSCSTIDTDSVDFYNNGKKYNEYGADENAQCLDSALLKTAKNQQECAARGDNIWMEDDTAGPNNTNPLSSGCYNQASDLTNEQACTAAGKGYQWKQTGGLDTSKTQDDDYGCVDPANPNGEDGEGAGGVDLQDGKETTKNCGEAGTILIACEGEGVVAIGNVLKIFINVLTVMIGVAAVGGLAWAAFTYAKAEDNASEVSSARALIRNITIGILLYGFMIAIINWLVPGGVI